MAISLSEKVSHHDVHKNTPPMTGLAPILSHVERENKGRREYVAGSY
jgi:hypothetical protein